MLGPGDAVPDVLVWTAAPREEPKPLRQVLGAGYLGDECATDELYPDRADLSSLVVIDEHGNRL